MANKRVSEMIQESLDDLLSPQEAEELFSVLERDDEAANEYTRLKQVDRLLNTAPFERAPERLAVTIMARLAQSVEAEAGAEAMPETLHQALMLSLAMVMVVMMPMMMTASWLVLHGMAKPELLNVVMYRIIAMLVMVLESIEVLLEEAQHLVHENPEAAALAMALIPIVLSGMLDYMQGDELDDDE